MKTSVKTAVYTGRERDDAVKMSEATPFVQRLHGRLDRRADGVVAWMHKAPGGRIETIYGAPGEVPPRVVRWSAGSVWISVATFLTRRLIDNVVCVPALWVDLDPESGNPRRVG